MITDTLVEEATAKQTEWTARNTEIRAEGAELRKQLALETDETKKAELDKKMAEITQAVQDHYKARDDFIEQIATGHVWVYLRK